MRLRTLRTLTMRALTLGACVFVAAPTLGQPAEDFYPRAYSPAFAPGAGPRVAIDEHHGNLHRADGSYAPFANLLRRDGFRVASLAAPFTADALGAVDILVIANATGPRDAASRAAASAFTAEEIAAVEAWVLDGGALLLIADHDPWPAAASLLAAPFGIELYNAYVYDGAPGERSGTITYSLSDGRLAEHTVTESVDAVTSFLGSALRVTGEHVALMRLSPRAVAQRGMDPNADGAEPVGEWLQGALLERGDGRVAVFSEAGMFSAQTRGGRPMGMNAPGAEDNARFALNVLRWLAEPR